MALSIMNVQPVGGQIANAMMTAYMMVKNARLDKAKLAAQEKRDEAVAEYRQDTLAQSAEQFGTLSAYQEATTQTATARLDLEERRLDISKMNAEAYKNQSDFATNEFARQIQVAKASGDKTGAKLKQAQLDAYNSLTPNQQQGIWTAQSDAAKNNKMVRAMQAQINASNQQIKLQAAQLNMKKFKQMQIKSTRDEMIGDSDDPTVAALASVYSENKYITDTSNDPNIAGPATMKSEAALDRIIAIKTEAAKLKDTTIKTDYPMAVQDAMNQNVLIRASNHFKDTGKRLPVKELKFIDWARISPGGQPFIRNEVFDKLEADARGMQLQWSQVPTVSGEVKKALKDRKNKALKDVTSYTGVETSEVSANRAAGNRADGSTKGPGWDGEWSLNNKDGTVGVATEYSRAGKVNGKFMEYPLIVPTLTSSEKAELKNVIEGRSKKVPNSIEKKALKWAEDRDNAGESPFAIKLTLQVLQKMMQADPKNSRKIYDDNIDKVE